jgi:hypothetical protein
MREEETYCSTAIGPQEIIYSAHRRTSCNDALLGNQRNYPSSCDSIVEEDEMKKKLAYFASKLSYQPQFAQSHPSN